MDLTPVILEGKSVRLEPLTIDHLDALLAAGADPEIWRYMPSDCARREGMREYVETAVAWQRAGTAIPFATIDRQSGVAIGSTRLANIVPEHKRVEIGWTWISPPFQRTAINTEAKYMMLKFAFEKLGCNRIELKTSAQNMRSRNAILRIGAKEEGTLRSHMVNPDGTLRDTVYFSIIAPEWVEVKKRLEEMMATR
ncbi:MAG TPA: GNAT family N-acetyltransferase [Bryobacteraceae bacterium]|nr:GNAT family N-acetyltransferase [Bryobacteraceae bacterium]